MHAARCLSAMLLSMAPGCGNATAGSQSPIVPRDAALADGFTPAPIDDLDAGDAQEDADAEAQPIDVEVEASPMDMDAEWPDAADADASDGAEGGPLTDSGDAEIDCFFPDADASETAPDGGDDLYQRLLAKLRQCGYITGDDFQLRPLEDELMRCEAKCYLAAECPAVLGTRCNTDHDPELGLCLGDCYGLTPKDGLDCGLGILLWEHWRCDGIPVCPEGEDERSCPVHTCADGEIVTAAFARCNGVPDCADGSDELGCDLACSLPR